VSDVSRTVQFPFGHSVAALGAVGGGIVGENVIWPLCGVMFWVGPVTFWVTTGCPGATLPPLFTHSYVAATEVAVRNAVVGPFPSPAAFPLHVRPVLTDFVQVGVPMKCGLSANAGTAKAMAASTASEGMITRKGLRIWFSFLEAGCRLLASALKALPNRGPRAPLRRWHTSPGGVEHA